MPGNVRWPPLCVEDVVTQLVESVKLATEMDYRGRQDLVACASIFRGLFSRLRASVTLFVEAPVAALESTRTPSSSPPEPPRGITGDGLVSGNCVGLVTDCADALSAATAIGIKSGIPVTWRPAAGKPSLEMSQMTSGVAWQKVR